MKASDRESAGSTAPKKPWFSIREAADYLDVGEQTIYRWMREGMITYRKVGDSTRFWLEDLDAVMKVIPSEKDAAKVQKVCPVCHHSELVEGHVQSTGANYFYPGKTKFWTFKMSHLETRARMCTRCGAVVWFADPAKLKAIRNENPAKEESK